MMRHNLKILVSLASLLLASTTAFAQGTAFTYQGKLADNNNPANGQYDFQFTLFDTQTVGTGNQQGAIPQVSNVTVTNGVFTVQIDFGACPTCFNGAARFLEIAVRPTGGGSFTTLGPRQPITSTPYAIRSQNAANATTADGLSVACVNCVTSSQIQSVNGSAVTGTIPLASVPTGSTNYIQNGTSPQAASNFNISGNGTANILNAMMHYSLAGLRVFTVNGAFNDGAEIFTASNTFGGDGAGLNTAPDPSLFSAVGKRNAFFGAGAGQANTTGSSNAFFGYRAGQANNEGLANAFFGAEAGRANTLGDQNAFFGLAAGRSNTGGGANSFFGTSAGISNTIGDDNAFFGAFAGERNTVGQKNTFIGNLADFSSSNPTGDNNTLLGAISRVISGSSNATAIGFRAQVEQNNSLVLGSINLVNSATADTKVGIGTTTPAALLDVQRDGSAIPQTAWFTTYGAPNEILGRASDGTRASPTATLNGTTLLSLGATGHNGNGFVTVPRASIVMDAAQAWAPSATGTQMRFRTTANDTTGILTRMIITNDGNVGVGNSGPNTRLDVVDATGAAPIRFGSSTADNGGYLVSTTASQAILAGGAKFNGAAWIAKSTLASLFSNENGTIRFFTDSGLTTGSSFSPTEQMRINNAGDVGIGVTAPADKLQVAGDIRVGTGLNGCVKDANGTIIAGSCSSDARLKRDITPFPHLLDKLALLQPVHFYWRTAEFPDRHLGAPQSFGLVAQEVEQVLPELVREDAQGFKTVNYSKLPLLTLQAIKELKAENDALKEKLQKVEQQQAQIMQQQLVISSLMKLVECRDEIASPVRAALRGRPFSRRANTRSKRGGQGVPLVPVQVRQRSLCYTPLVCADHPNAEICK